MPHREQARKQGRAEGSHEDLEAPSPTRNEGASTADVDALLEDIDDVLESNAEDFVKSFVQKGGQ